MIRRKLQLNFTATHGAWRLCTFALALSVLALSFFAMVWFDVLKRFVTLRSAGHPPREAG